MTAKPLKTELPARWAASVTAIKAVQVAFDVSEAVLEAVRKAAFESSLSTSDQVRVVLGLEIVRQAKRPPLHRDAVKLSFGSGSEKSPIVCTLMKLKFQHFFRGYVFVLVTVLLWSVWANGQGTTNLAENPNPAPAAAMTPTNATVETALTFGLDQVEFLQGKLWGNPLWQYIASLTYIFLAFYVSKGLDYLTRVWLKKWAAKTETTLDDLLLDLLHGPVKIVSFVIFLHIGLRVFAWPAWVADILSKGLKIVVAWSLTPDHQSHRSFPQLLEKPFRPRRQDFRR